MDAMAHANLVLAMVDAELAQDEVRSREVPRWCMPPLRCSWRCTMSTSTALKIEQTAHLQFSLVSELHSHGHAAKLMSPCPLQATAQGSGIFGQLQDQKRA
jgi:hypothetical protein